ncbi:MAG: ABC transporter substrate-binding protein [Gammaproteobacteria bacterium]|nr:ABC transporter substrate-binding protein [Gammaproteobacteria bacterium]
MHKKDPILEQLRHQSNDIENSLIDDYLAGHLTRRQLLRHASVLGMTSLVGGIGVALSPTAARAATSSTLRVASTAPTATIDPIKVSDTGGLVLLCQTGEFLVNSGGDLLLTPVLATSWKPSTDGKVWTFKLRKGVKFHNGKAMTANDVVATFDRLTDPANASSALSVFKDVLSKGSVRKVDDFTVEFQLDAANGNFPYLVSSDNYNSIILPADYAGDFEKNFIGTGPFKLEKYTPKVGVSFVRNPDYWGMKALVERVEFSFFDNAQAQILAFQGRRVDVIQQISVLKARGLLKDPDVNLIRLKSSAHSQVHMRTDMAPFTDKRVRQALALCLNRPKIIQGLFQNLASLGNDSPFAPAFPSTDTSVPQRAENIQKAKQLMAAAGAKDGFNVTLTTEKYLEIPEYAVLIQNAAKKIGINITLNVKDQSAYYGKAVYGESDWLDSVLGITDYGHRGVPNVVLGAPLKSDGTWNSAHFKNKEYDRLVTNYVAALDTSSQRTAAGEIQRLLLDETPAIFGYFYDFLAVTAKNVVGVKPTAMSHLFLGQARFT